MKIKDLALYVLISLVLIGAVLLAAWNGIREDLLMKYVAFTFVTFAFLGSYFRDSAGLRSTNKFWYLSVILLAFHTAIWIVVLNYGKPFKITIWALLPEAIILRRCRDKFLTRYPAEGRAQSDPNA